MKLKQLYFLLFYFFIGWLSSFFCFLQAGNIERLVPIVVAKLPHDRHAFTQGLSIAEDQLYESTGLYGHSSVRHLDIVTGQILKEHFLSTEHFAEGIAAFSHQIFQITWKEQQAFVYDRSSLKLLRTLAYLGEGWGLCRDQNTVWMSNGTSQLTQRDLQTFAILKILTVYWKNHPISYLNDLECDGNDLYANVWLRDWLIRIDKATGEVTAIVDASHLLSPQEKAHLTKDHVLNGIAFRPKTGTFFITGKGWPWIFEVRLAPEKEKIH